MYQDYDSDSDVPEELKQDYVDEQTGDAPLKRSVPSRVLLQAVSIAQKETVNILESFIITTCKILVYFNMDNFRCPLSNPALYAESCSFVPMNNSLSFYLCYICLLD